MLKRLRDLAIVFALLVLGGIVSLSLQPLIATAAPTNSAAYSNPARLYGTPHQVDQVRSADDLGVVMMGRYDVTPVAVGDGDANDLRIAQTGELHTFGGGPVPGSISAVARTTVACDDSGTVAFTSNALDKVVWVSNTDTVRDICISFGTAGLPDEAVQATCDLFLGAYAGSGTRETVSLPDGFGTSFECAASAASNLLVTAHR